MSLFPILLICIWLIISTSIYAGLWFAFIRRFGSAGIFLFNLGLSIILSPGILAVGHGAIPFPGGVAFLLDGPNERMGPISVFNFAMGMLTFSIFLAYSWVLKKN